MATVFLGLQKKIGKIWKRSLTVHSVSNPHPWNIWRIRRWLMSRLVPYDIITTKMQWNGMQKHKSRLAKESKKTCAQTCMSGSKEREPWTKSQAACMMAGWGAGEHGSFPCHETCANEPYDSYHPNVSRRKHIPIPCRTIGWRWMEPCVRNSSLAVPGKYDNSMTPWYKSWELWGPLLLRVENSFLASLTFQEMTCFFFVTCFPLPIILLSSIFCCLHQSGMNLRSLASVGDRAISLSGHAGDSILCMEQDQEESPSWATQGK